MSVKTIDKRKNISLLQQGRIQQERLILRNEIKYIINQADYMYITRRLRRSLKFDTHASRQTMGYQVDSLYFDDPKNSCLFEKEAGVENRNKYRIRIYNSSPDVIMLEKKMKRGPGVAKKDLRIDLEEYSSILNGDIGWMKKNGEALLLDFYERTTLGNFSPRVVVSYFREPYVYPAGNVRITFDKYLASWGRCLDLFSTSIPRQSIFNSSLMIMEVKYTGFLPSFISRLIDIGNREAEACSKYGYCINYN